ncbi:MAG: FtsQ-type POTRA domain-containing protein [Actinomycetes bacterium]
MAKAKTPTAKKASRPVPEVDPRIAKRRQDVERRSRRWRVRIVITLVIGVVLAGGLWALLHTSAFSARTITVHLGAHETRHDVVVAAGLKGHPSLVSIDTSAAAARIEALPWVAKATVVRHWPSSVEVRVVERRAAAVTPAAQGWAAVDGTGRVLGVDPEHGPDAMILRVQGVHPGKPGTSLSKKANPALEVARTLPPAFRQQVHAVIGHTDGTVVLRLTAPITVNLGSVAQLTEKYRDVASILAGASLHAGDVVDVSVPQASTISQP